MDKPRGKTPVDVTLEAFHHYEVQVVLLGTGNPPADPDRSGPATAVDSWAAAAETAGSALRS